MQLSGADILVQTLIEQGCSTVFGYPGGQVIHIYDSLYKYKEKIHHVLSAHEQGAAHAADGYARASGEVGVVIATSGPGATNLVTGIATAYLDSVPMVAITGNVPNAQIGTDSFQEIDITGVTLPITKHNFFVGSVEQLAFTVREAFRLAKSGRPGPVLIDIPKDVQIAMGEYVPQQKMQADPMFAAKELRIKQAAECINQSRRPFVYFGGGVLAADARDEVIALAEKLDAPMGCSLMGLSGVPTNHPRFLGMQGMHGHYACSTAMHHADCIIALGGRFNDRVTGNRAKFATGAKIVHIDIDGAELSKTVNATHGLRGDLKCTVQQLLPLLQQKCLPDWQAEIAKFKADGENALDIRDGMTPRNVLSALDKRLGDNTPVATDVGQHQMWAAQTLSFKNPRRFLSSGGLGTMGFGMGAAIGAAFATGERTVLVTGDGSFGMCLNELATAVKNKVPLVIFLLNNGVLGMVRQWQTLFFDKHYSETVLDRATDFVKLTEAFGGQAMRATTLDEVETALDAAFQADGPFLVECTIDKDEFVLPMLPPGGSMDDIIVKVGD